MPGDDRFDYEEYGPHGPEPPPRANGHDPAPDLISVELPPVGIAEIPPRAWAYGHFLLFGHASAIGAVDGGGKGALAVAISLAMITGRPLLGERVWRRGPVAVITYEDDETEWQRRIAGAGPGVLRCHSDGCSDAGDGRYHHDAMDTLAG